MRTKDSSAHTVLILVGAGGHARVVLDAARLSTNGATLSVRDDNAALAGTLLDGVLIQTPALPDLATLGGAAVHIAIGHNDVRVRLAQRVQALGAVLVSVIHPRATVAASARIAPGCFIAAGSIVGPGAALGENCIVNHNAVIDHDCILEAGVHIAPGVVLGGGARIGAGTLVGAGAVILPRITVGAHAVIGAGAVVTRSVPSGAQVLGVPARNPLNR